MQQDFKLESWEKKLEGVLICIVLCIFTTICFDMYFLHFEINTPPILITFLYLFCISFFILLGINGLKSGNLILRWLPLNWILRSILVNIFRISRFKTQQILAKTTALLCLSIASFGIYILYSQIN